MAALRSEPEDTLWVVTDLEPAERPGAVERGYGAEIAEGVASAVSLGTISANMREFLAQVQDMLRGPAAEVGQFEVTQVELTAKISAEGKLCLLGSGGGAKAEGGIKFVLQRKPPPG